MIDEHSYAKRKFDDECAEVLENRELLIQVCDVHNTKFEKTVHKQVTYRRAGTKEDAPIENGGYEQLDYIIVRRRFKTVLLTQKLITTPK